MKDEHLAVFDCAFKPRNGVRSIAWRAHVQMMAAAQPFLSGAISKTVNMPRDTTPADIADAYLEGWQLGLKALAIYRDGSKESQPLSTSTEADKAAAKQVAVPRRERLPDTRQSITHKFNVAGHEGYITVGLYDDGRPGELFITMAKEGSTIGGLMDCFGTAVSMSLQYGVPLEVYVGKFSHTRFEPMGHTKNPDIRIAKSIVDYIFRWLGITFIPGYNEANPGLSPDSKSAGSPRIALRKTATKPPFGSARRCARRRTRKSACPRRSRLRPPRRCKPRWPPRPSRRTNRRDPAKPMVALAQSRFVQRRPIATGRRGDESRSQRRPYATQQRAVCKLPIGRSLVR